MDLTNLKAGKDVKKGLVNAFIEIMSSTKTQGFLLQTGLCLQHFDFHLIMDLSRKPWAKTAIHLI
jgi:hypothetical protein